MASNGDSVDGMEWRRKAEYEMLRTNMVALDRSYLKRTPSELP